MDTQPGGQPGLRRAATTLIVLIGALGVSACGSGVGGTSENFTVKPNKALILSADKRAILTIDRGTPQGNGQIKYTRPANKKGDEGEKSDHPNNNKFDDQEKTVEITFTPASGTIVCAEPQPDAIRGVAQEIAARLTAPLPQGQTINAQAAAAASETVASIARRTPTVQLMRDALYRTCEAVMNGVLGTQHVEFIAGQIDNMMLGLHAIDGLTAMGQRGPVVAIGTTNKASTTGAGEGENGEGGVEAGSSEIHVTVEGGVEASIEGEDLAKIAEQVKEIVYISISGDKYQTDQAEADSTQ